MFDLRISLCSGYRSFMTTCAIVFFALSGCVFLSGCNVLEPVTYAIEGPPTVPALFQLPEKKIVVFVDDRSSIIPRTRLRRVLADRATNELLREQQIVPAAVEASAAVRIAQTEDADGLMSIAEIGRRVGADIVIYARPIRFSLSSGGMPKPIAVLGVKVINTRTGVKMFPTDAESSEYTLTATMSAKTGSHYETEQSRQTLEESLADYAGLRLAQIFYEHEPNPLDGDLSR